ncbi:MAG: manganese-dependent inorganic pyrophosphatase [Burkholderiales bacterium]
MISRYMLAIICSLFMLLGSSASAAPVLVVGHKNPDSDSIFAAISLAYLKSQQGMPAVAIAQGKPNPESQFVLDYFGLQAPAVELKVAGNQVMLVDHNTYAQAPDDIKDAEIVGIIDHHSLGGMLTDEPVEVLIKPVGCTNTIIWQLYERAGVAIPPAIAGGMLSAIFSDTLVFRSPTTTDSDRAAVKSLASIAGIKDIQKYGQQMFSAGEADLKAAPIESLLQRDFKNFDMNGNKVGVAQLTAVNFSLLKDRKGEYLAQMQTLQKAQGYKSLVLMLTAIESEGSELLIVGENQLEIGQAFNVSLENHSAWAAGVMSRKKQVIPVLEKVFDRRKK